jgi:hypothetical protein
VSLRQVFLGFFRARTDEPASATGKVS